MMPMTVETAAQIARVTPKTIRQWIRDEGCPVIQEGGKGAGNGALIDAARFARWYLQREQSRRTTMADALAHLAPGCNPLRELTDQFRRGALRAIAATLRSWADEPNEHGDLDYRKAGISKTQARAVAWQVFAGTMMALAAYQTERFEVDLQAEIGADLDDLLSLWTEGDFRTRWPEPLNDIPTCILPCMPPKTRARLEAMSDDSADDSTPRPKA